jgi:hypothetical protein
MAEDWVNWMRLELNFGFCGLGETSEKGSTRKDTGNRVARCAFLFLGEYWDSR